MDAGERKKIEKSRKYLKEKRKKSKTILLHQFVFIKKKTFHFVLRSYGIIKSNFCTRINWRKQTYSYVLYVHCLFGQWTKCR